MDVDQSLPPVGSFRDGNISEPQMAHAEAAVTIPAKVRNAPCSLRLVGE